MPCLALAASSSFAAALPIPHPAPSTHSTTHTHEQDTCPQRRPPSRFLFSNSLPHVLPKQHSLLCCCRHPQEAVPPRRGESIPCPFPLAQPSRFSCARTKRPPLPASSCLACLGKHSGPMTLHCWASLNRNITQHTHLHNSHLPPHLCILVSLPASVHSRRGAIRGSLQVPRHRACPKLAAVFALSVQRMHDTWLCMTSTPHRTGRTPRKPLIACACIRARSRLPSFRKPQPPLVTTTRLGSSHIPLVVSVPGPIPVVYFS